LTISDELLLETILSLSSKRALRAAGDWFADSRFLAIVLRFEGAENAQDNRNFLMKH
jgi:hypothetical protein